MIVPMRTNRLRTLGTCLLLLLAACNASGTGTAPTSAPETASPSASAPTPEPTPAPELGTLENPILLALSPTQFMDPNVVANGQSLASMLEEQTGYRVVAVAPTTYTETIAGLKAGNAHIAVLPIFAIVKAYQEGAVQAAFASMQEEAASYGAQFVALSDRFTSYINDEDDSNAVPALEALTQFSGMKPCWTEQDSPSGYLVPLGILNWYKIPTQEGAFVQSHFSVVRAVRMGEICDFGATYIDAREFPALKDEYPFILDEVMVAWKVPPIIPYDGIFLSSSLPPEIGSRLKTALDLVFADANGKLLFESLFGIQGIVQVEDIFYVEFTRTIEASGVDINSLVH